MLASPVDRADPGSPRPIVSTKPRAGGPMTDQHRNSPPRSWKAAISRPEGILETALASLVLLAIALTISSASAGYEKHEGEAENGIRRAASQLDRKLTRGTSKLQRVKRARSLASAK